MTEDVHNVPNSSLVISRQDEDAEDMAQDARGQWLSSKDAARSTGVTVRTINRQIKAGHVSVRGPARQRKVWVSQDKMLPNWESLDIRTDDGDTSEDDGDERVDGDRSSDGVRDTRDAIEAAVAPIERALLAERDGRVAAEARAQDAERRAADAMADAARYRERSDWLSGQVSQLQLPPARVPWWRRWFGH